MRKIIFIIFCISVFSAVSFGVWIGGGVSKEFGSVDQSFFEGRVTVYSITDFYSVDLVAQLSQSDPNPLDWIGVYTYFNLVIPVDILDLYVGFSPTVIFNGGQLSASDFQSYGYVHFGTDVLLSFPYLIRVYGEIGDQFYYAPPHLGPDMSGAIGAEIRF
ncbi:MAG: hypothetical protein M1542_01000 [Thermotogae bacterium]|jgi:hypothetical protein|nr:hypothetical protein [Thermotogota bacterium]MCL5031814.1 hypothetical protein [Thermotogota bacterium]